MDFDRLVRTWRTSPPNENLDPDRFFLTQLRTAEETDQAEDKKLMPVRRRQKQWHAAG